MCSTVPSLSAIALDMEQAPTFKITAEQPFASLRQRTKSSYKYLWLGPKSLYSSLFRVLESLTMRTNENLVLVGSKVVLVPYKEEHVLKYHDWMQSPFLQEMTASEPLTLDEEYAMQRSWHEDEKKCTFIILAAPEDIATVDVIKKDGVMIGDVNIFLNDPDDDLTFGEIEIMIAEANYRRSGCGFEALKIMMAYALTELGLKTFHAKISMANEPSIRLFKNKLGFYPVSESKVFQEVTLEWSICTPPTPTSSLSCNDDDRAVSYGSTADGDQRKIVNSVRDELIDLWTMTIRKEQWE